MRTPEQIVDFIEDCIKIDGKIDKDLIIYLIENVKTK